MDNDAQTLLIKELFLAAKPLQGEERARYLTDHCPDAALRVEVERLLNADDPTKTALAAGGSGPPPTVHADLVRGAVLGHYRIIRKLGQGGMGSVYEALDEKLHRSAAVKVLKPGGVHDDMSKRLYREAESASALNHPNIVTIYEIGREGEVDYIAMERIAGNTLRQEIGPKGMPLSNALRYAVQIADALATAHDAHIVHRDLKPGNVMVTERGLVKVLDFGLAKSIASVPAGAADDDILLTAPGQVVGTLHYMSPEQAEGKPVDARSDIFAFGSLLFEMLTGQRAFQGSGVGLLISILQQEPALDLLPASVPKNVVRIITKCLQKRPSDRWQHIADVKLQLADILKDLESPPDSTIGAQPVRRLHRFAWPGVVAGCVAGALAVTGILFVMSSPADEASSKRVLQMVTADQGLNSFPALSKDGKLIAFSSDRSGEGHLDIWLQQIGGRDPLRLTKDPADETDPTFSPDGTRVAFRSEAKGGGVYIVPAIGGGEPVLLAPSGRSPRFSPDGQWVAYWTGREGSFVTGAARTFIVEAGGGQPRQIHPQMASAMQPAWSPRGDELIVLGREKGVGYDTLDWWILPLDNGSPRAAGAYAQLRSQNLIQSQRGLGVLPSVFDWTASPSDRVLFAVVIGDSANLWEFDLTRRGGVRGSARRVTEGPGRQVHAAWAMAEGGERIAFSDELLNYDIWVIPADANAGITRGDPKRLTTEASPEWSPSMSWDGKRITCISRHAGMWSLRLIDTIGGAGKPLIFSAAVLIDAKLVGDGSKVIYSGLDYALYSVPSAGGPAAKLCDRCGTVTGASSDGARVLYEPLEDEDLMMFDTLQHKSVKLAQRPRNDILLSAGQFSPDGNWVAFHALDNQRATGQVWITSVSSGQTVPQANWIAVTGGDILERDPAWAPGGSLIYFISERDGFTCMWARRLDPTTKKPFGEPFPVQHFHSARQSLRRSVTATHLTGLSVGGNQILFAMSELTGNIWFAEALRPR